MFRPRVIPVLLLRGGALVKSVRFRRHRYIGDPLNAIRLFNEHDADELVLLDIDATREGRSIDAALVQHLGEEANMPLTVGGGITQLSQIRGLIAAGAEKVVIGTAVHSQPNLIVQAATTFGSSAVAVCMDVVRNWRGKERVYIRNATLRLPESPVAFAEKVQALGAGEFIIGGKVA